MNADVQVIEKNGKPEWAVIPYQIYLALIEKAERLQDIRDYDTVEAALARGEEELLPSRVVDALLSGESPLKVWREHRQMTQQHLARDAGISVPYLSQIESGKRKGSTEVLTAIAEALDITLDDLVIRPGSEPVDTAIQER